MGTLYNFSLFIHSWNRWLIIIAGVLLIILLIAALTEKYRDSKGVIGKTALTFIITLHIQLLVGLLLYFFLSPLTQVAFNDFGLAMKNPGIRFWAVEHSFMNILGIILAQIGYSKAKRKPVGKYKYKTLLVWMSIALIIILLVIPMGIMGVERPWFRL